MNKISENGTQEYLHTETLKDIVRNKHFKLKKTGYLLNYWMGIIVKRAWTSLNGGSLEIMTKVPLTRKLLFE